MDKHKFNIFPEMKEEDYYRLKSDIERNGYDNSQPIYIFNGFILDGWNRYKACQELNVTPATKEFQGDEIAALEFVMRTNKRRNLTSSQWAAIAVLADDIWNVLQKEIERERRKKQAETQSKKINKDEAMVQKIEPQSKDNSKLVTKKIADMFNTNRTYVSDAKKYKDENPEIFEDIKRGDKSITEVKKEEKIAKRKAEIEEIRRKIENEPQTVEGDFDVIVIDPPWNYNEKGGFSYEQYDPDGNRGGVNYPTMTINKLKNINLPCKKNSVLFLWTTHAFLRDAFDLLDVWGLKYKATMVWDKEIMGMGRTIRMQCEFCLIATKGSPIITGQGERDIIREKRREHSRKPEAFYSKVDRMCVGRKLDYFSREQRNGWISYGAEISKF